MPMLTRECLALKFRQNWLAKHPVDVAPTQSNGLDDSLTSLNWLQNLNIMKIGNPTPPASPQPMTTLLDNLGDMRVNPNHILNMSNLAQIKQEPGTIISRPYPMLDVSPPMATSPCALDKIDYKTNPHVKPPYSYATLICMAMRESKKNKITLAGIYNWITENFIYYRIADPSWQNSIRHNLSLNKCFQKVPRRKDEPGKGGFWRINPEYSDMFVNGIFKKRRSSTRENIAPPTKRIKKESEDSTLNGIMQFLNATNDMSRFPRIDPLRENQEAVSQITQGAEDRLTDPLRGPDFSWNTILNQDIDVDGIRIKTENIIDDKDSIASPITSFSPPPSDSNSEVGLEDFLGSDLSADLSVDAEGPLDLTSGEALDLTVSGTTLRAPEWWNESLNTTTSRAMGFLSPSHNSGLNTPLAQSPAPDSDYAHPWAEDRHDLDEAIQSFDVDIHNLFDMGNIPSPTFQDS